MRRAHLISPCDAKGERLFTLSMNRRSIDLQLFSATDYTFPLQW